MSQKLIIEFHPEYDVSELRNEVDDLMKGHIDGYVSTSVENKTPGRKIGQVNDSPNRGSTADKVYNLKVGQSTYIESPQSTIYASILRSPHLVNDGYVLSAMIVVPRGKDLSDTAHITKIARVK